MIDSRAPLNFKDVGLWVTCRLIVSINHTMCLNWAVYILAQNFILSCLLLCLKCVRAVLCKVMISQWVNLLHSPSMETWADPWPPCTLPEFGWSPGAHIICLSWSQTSRWWAMLTTWGHVCPVWFSMCFQWLEPVTVFFGSDPTDTWFINMSCSSVSNMTTFFVILGFPF